MYFAKFCNLRIARKKIAIKAKFFDNHTSFWLQVLDYPYDETDRCCCLGLTAERLSMARNSFCNCLPKSVNRSKSAPCRKRNPCEGTDQEFQVGNPKGRHEGKTALFSPVYMEQVIVSGMGRLIGRPKTLHPLSNSSIAQQPASRATKTEMNEMMQLLVYIVFAISMAETVTEGSTMGRKTSTIK